MRKIATTSIILALLSPFCHGAVQNIVSLDPVSECANVHTEDVTQAYFINPCLLHCELKSNGVFNHSFWDGIECDHEKICDEGDCELVSQAKHVPDRNAPGNWGSISLMTLKADLTYEEAFVNMYLNETKLCNTSTFNNHNHVELIVWNQGCTADNIYWSTKFEFRLMDTDGAYFGSASMTFRELLVRGLNGKETSFELRNGPIMVKVTWVSNSLTSSEASENEVTEDDHLSKHSNLNLADSLEGSHDSVSQDKLFGYLPSVLVNSFEYIWRYT